MTAALLYTPGAFAIVAGMATDDRQLVVAGGAYWFGLAIHRLCDAWREMYR